MKWNLKVIAAFFAIYVIWGSTYLAIRYGIETFPPMLLAALRFSAAALLILPLSLIRREKMLSKPEAKIAILSGVLLIGANGFVSIAELNISSGLAAVVVGALPIWILFLSWGFFQGPKPRSLQLIGSGIGLFGIGLIASDQFGLGSNSFLPFLLLLVACTMWSIGTLMQKKLKSLESPFAFSSLQMFSGAIATGLWALVSGEVAGFRWEQVSSTSLMSLLYLITFGSLIAFSAYNWLSRNVEPHLVSTYALVNPVIAVALGSLIAGENLGGPFLAATALVLAGLAMMMKK